MGTTPTRTIAYRLAGSALLPVVGGRWDNHWVHDAGAAVQVWDGTNPDTAAPYHRYSVTPPPGYPCGYGHAYLTPGIELADAARRLRLILTVPAPLRPAEQTRALTPRRRYFP